MSSPHNSSLILPPTFDELEYIMAQVSSHRARLVRSYTNQTKWLLLPEEIAAELNVEIAKAISKYWPKPLDEFVRIIKGMMVNRCNDLFRTANKTHRRVESNAYVLEEDGFYRHTVRVVDNPREFMFAGGMASLSSIAMKIVEQFFDPDDVFAVALQDHAQYRRTLWGGNGETGGGGVKRIPVAVFAQALGEDPARIKEALEEIKETLFWEEAMTTQDSEIIEDILSNIDWDEQLQWPGNVVDKDKRRIGYVRWAQAHINGQVMYRLEHDETFAQRMAKEFPTAIKEGELPNLDAIKRIDLIRQLKEDDKKHDRVAVTDYESVGEKKKKKEKEGMKAQAVINDGFDERFNVTSAAKEAKEEPAVEESFEEFGAPSVPAIEEKEEEESEPVVEEAPEEEEKEPEENSPSVEGEYQFEGDPLTEMMRRMRKGEKLHLTYEGNNHWTMVVVVNDSDSDSTEQEDEEPTKKFKKGSPEWNDIVWSEEHKKFDVWAEKVGIGGVRDAIREEVDPEYTLSTKANPGLIFFNAKLKLRAARGIKEFNEIYEAAKKRKAVTL